MEKQTIIDALAAIAMFLAFFLIGTDIEAHDMKFCNQVNSLHNEYQRRVKSTQDLWSLEKEILALPDGKEKNIKLEAYINFMYIYLSGMADTKWKSRWYDFCVIDADKDDEHAVHF